MVLMLTSMVHMGKDDGENRTPNLKGWQVTFAINAS